MKGEGVLVKTRREPIPGGSGSASLPRTVFPSTPSPFTQPTLTLC